MILGLFIKFRFKYEIHDLYATLYYDGTILSFWFKSSIYGSNGVQDLLSHVGTLYGFYHHYIPPCLHLSRLLGFDWFISLLFVSSRLIEAQFAGS